MGPRKNRGFTLVELLVAMAIIGILAAIAIVNYLGALERSRQKRTMSDMRTIAVAWEARAAETHSYGAAGFTFPADNVTIEWMKSELTPSYIQHLPEADGWGTPFEFAWEPATAGAAQRYAIRSSGADRTFEGEYDFTRTSDPDCDIVFADGTFVTYPDSIKPN